MKWPDGSVYGGQFKNGMPHGYGRLVDTDGDMYEGHWKENMCHG